MKPLHVTATANASLQNRMNVSIVFHHIREQGPVYRAKIARDLRLSAPAVSRAVEALKSEGYIVETGKVRTVSGKRAAHVMVDNSRGWFIAIDLLKEPTKIAVSNLACEIVEQREGFTLDDSVDVESELTREIEEVVGRYGGRGELEAICIGVPAVVDDEGAVAAAFLYRSLEGRSIRRLLEERFEVPVFVENGANLSALAEAKHGAGRDSRNFIFVEISNGIGAGIVVEGNLVHGGHGAAGEIGFSPTRAFSPTVSSSEDHDESVDYLERVASVDSLRRLAVEALRRGESSPALQDSCGGDLSAITPAFVCRAALEGDEVCCRILRATTDYLSMTVVTLALVLDPERIILGGDICHLPGVETLFAEPIRRNLKRALPFEGPELLLSGLSDNAGLIGSAQLAVDSLLTRLYPYRMDGARPSNGHNREE